MAEKKTPATKKAPAKKPATPPTGKKAPAKKAPTKRAPTRKAAAASKARGKPVAKKSTAKAAPKKAAASVFTISQRDDGIALVAINDEAEAQNTLKSTFAPQFEKVLEQLAGDKSIKGLIIHSTKPGSFIAGADIGMFENLTTASEVTALSKVGQKGFDRLEKLPFPTIAAINGACLGGGLELAMACDYRIATENKAVKLGLPEVQLGLLPGAGGTQRLPRLAGIQTALDMMLTGKQLNAARAKKAGIIDKVVDENHLLTEAAQYLQKNKEKRPTRAPLQDVPARKAKGISSNLTSVQGLTKVALEDNPAGRAVLFDQARKQTLKQSHGLYPAPMKIIDCVERGYRWGFGSGLAAEAKAFGELAMTPESRSLVHLFRAITALKKDTGVDDEKVKPREINKVGVLGAGLMGAGIATVTADKAGLPTFIKDRDRQGLQNGYDYVRKVFDGRVKKKRIGKVESFLLQSKVKGTLDYADMKNCDIVIEAVFEDIKLKHQMLKDIETNCGSKAIFASNTSSIPITRIAEAAKRPENVIGLHYFSPVEKMPLLEIIVTDKTAPEVTAASVQFGKDQGKTVIVVNDGPGFYTTRILAPYLNEAARMMSEGVAVEDVDKALVKWGFPVGPVTLMDEVGIDVGFKIVPVLVEAFGDRFRAPEASEKMIEDGRLGRKANKGFFKYEKGKKAGVDESVYDLMGVKPTKKLKAEEIAERCAWLMLNEAAYCLEEGILRSARDGDIGAIFGLGFPPFRGGPFWYMEKIGIAESVRKLESLAKQHGERFEPAPILRKLAKSGGKF